ncbi:protein of unknown function [Methylocaldum szegediense]|uniref:Uncharacterized protein n=1 Tax=Methylocaldum szegediense TaxID=73780 RepID=A0ABM9HXI6_9GAMM|nr:protein of unknown function [Methylocaldum szegediense]
MYRFDTCYRLWRVERVLSHGPAIDRSIHRFICVLPEKDNELLWNGAHGVDRSHNHSEQQGFSSWYTNISVIT